MMEMTQLINRVSDLPALPEIVIHLNNLLKDNSSGIDNVAGVIEKDAALSSKVLRLANSSYYGLASQVDSVSRAIIVLGFNTVCNVVTSVGVSAIFRDAGKDSGIDMAGLWMHTLGCAVASKAVIGKKNEQDAERAFVCGILHDIGKVVIAKTAPEEQRNILGLLAGNPRKTLLEAESEVLGFSHAEIGYAIAKKWHFPDYILDAIRYHHQPASAKISSGIVSAVHLGNAISKALALGKSTEPRVTSVSPAAWGELNIRPSHLPSLVNWIQNAFDLAMEIWTLD